MRKEKEPTLKEKLKVWGESFSEKWNPIKEKFII